MLRVVVLGLMGEGELLVARVVAITHDAANTGGRMQESAGWGQVRFSSVARLATFPDSVRKQVRTEDRDNRLASISLGQ